MISTSLRGRLGNQLFQYSVCRIIAHKNNFNFYIPDTGELSTDGFHLKNFFEDLDTGIIDGKIKYHIHDDIYSQIFNPNLLNCQDYTEIHGFFQCPKYFDGYENVVRSWFKLSQNENSINFLEKYDVNKYCYIHLRATDYKSHSHWFLEEKYYQDAMNHMKNIFPNISFVIITDDINESKKLFPDIDCFSHDMKTDFLILLNSKYNIISNSTFSWWTAWLKEKEMTIAPNNWLNYNRPDLGFYPNSIKTKEFIYI